MARHLVVLEVEHDGQVTDQKLVVAEGAGPVRGNVATKLLAPHEPVERDVDHLRDRLGADDARRSGRAARAAPRPLRVCSYPGAKLSQAVFDAPLERTVRITRPGIEKR